MSKEQVFLWIAEVVMFAALVSFITAFRVRKLNRERHMLLGKLGACLVLTGLLLLEVLMRGFGWEFPIRSTAVLRWHIGVSSAASVLLLALVITGVYRVRRVHVRLYLFFFPPFLASLILSFFAFRLW